MANDQVNINVFQLLAKKMSNMKPIMRIVSQDMLDVVKENFEKEGRPPWEKLAKSTIQERTRLGYWPGKILQRRGGGSGLLGSIFAKYDENSAIVGTNKAYAPIHQFGGTFVTKPRIHAVNRRGKFKSKRKAEKDKRKTDIRFMSSTTIRIPARPFLTIPDNELNTIKKKIIDYLTK